MQLGWLLVVCMVEGICDHRGLKSTISSTHHILPSCHILLSRSFTGAGHTLQNEWTVFHSCFFILITYCRSYPSAKKHLNNIEWEKEKQKVCMIPRVIKWFLSNASPIPTPRMTQWKRWKFRDVVFIMFNPFKNKNIWGEKIATQCYRSNYQFNNFFLTKREEDNKVN